MVTLFLARSGKGQFLLLMNVQGNHQPNDQTVRPKVTLVFKLPTAVREYFFLISSLSFPTGKPPAKWTKPASDNFADRSESQCIPAGGTRAH